MDTTHLKYFSLKIGCLNGTLPQGLFVNLLIPNPSVMRIALILFLGCLWYLVGHCQQPLHPTAKDSLTKMIHSSKAADTSSANRGQKKNGKGFQWPVTSDCIAALALCASCLSVWISSATYRNQREHNIRSVRPILHVGQLDYEDRLIVTLKNCGAGIAIVKHYSVHRISDNSRHANIYACLPSKLRAGVNYKEYWTPDRDFVVQTEQVIPLVHIPIDMTVPEQVEERQRLRLLLSDLVVHLTFEDIYENAMTEYTRSLDFFGRTDNVNTSVIW